MAHRIRPASTGLIAVVFAGMAQAGWADCRDTLVRVEGDWGHANFTVEVADDFQERAQGLMHRDTMGMLEGMLFVYDGPQRASFWMRNTLISLDMLFVTPDGTIAHIHPEAIPLDETSILGGDGIQFVPEINGGLAERLGIEAGDVIQHPSIGPDAVLACDP